MEGWFVSCSDLLQRSPARSGVKACMWCLWANHILAPDHSQCVLEWCFYPSWWKNKVTKSHVFTQGHSSLKKKRKKKTRSLLKIWKYSWYIVFTLTFPPKAIRSNPLIAAGRWEEAGEPRANKSKHGKASTDMLCKKKSSLWPGGALLPHSDKGSVWVDWLIDSLVHRRECECECVCVSFMWSCDQLVTRPVVPWRSSFDSWDRLQHVNRNKQTITNKETSTLFVVDMQHAISIITTLLNVLSAPEHVDIVVKMWPLSNRKNIGRTDHTGLHLYLCPLEATFTWSSKSSLHTNVSSVWDCLPLRLPFVSSVHVYLHQFAKWIPECSCNTTIPFRSSLTKTTRIIIHMFELT